MWDLQLANGPEEADFFSSNRLRRAVQFPNEQRTGGGILALRNFASMGDKKAVVKRLLLSNRLWVFTNGCLFLRGGHVLPRGAQASDWVFRRAWPLALSRRGEVAALVVDLGRFGNAMSRVTNSLSIALDNKWSAVLIPRSGHFPAYKDLVSGEPVASEGLLVSFGEDRWRLKSVPDYLVRRDYNYPKNHDSTDKTAVRNIVRLIFSGLTPSEPPDENELTIHIRSGDIYYRSGVGNWGQPPYSYYEKVIREGDWSRVVVVCEDSESPVIQPISVLCRTLAIPYRFQSSNLVNDLAVLLAARTLMVGRGSFAPAVVLMSPNIRCVYFFEDRFRADFIDEKVQVVKVSDSKGDYRDNILGGLWVNSPAQREMMRTYPLTALVFSEGGLSDALS
jgi:hypothetical protein